MSVLAHACPNCGERDGLVSVLPMDGAQATLQRQMRARSLVDESVELIERGEYGRAEAVLREAQKQNPHNACAFGNLGGVFFEQERFEEAIPWLEKALTIDPGLEGIPQALEEARRRAGGGNSLGLVAMMGITLTLIALVVGGVALVLNAIAPQQSKTAVAKAPPSQPSVVEEDVELAPSSSTTADDVDTAVPPSERPKANEEITDVANPKTGNLAIRDIELVSVDPATFKVTMSGTLAPKYKKFAFAKVILSPNSPDGFLDHASKTLADPKMSNMRLGGFRGGSGYVMSRGEERGADQFPSSTTISLSDNEHASGTLLVGFQVHGIDGAIIIAIRLLRILSA
jgi:hypothetical protein